MSEQQDVLKQDDHKEVVVAENVINSFDESLRVEEDLDVETTPNKKEPAIKAFFNKMFFTRKDGTVMSRFEKKKKIATFAKKAVVGILWALGIVTMVLCLSNLYQQVFNPDGYTGFFGVGEAVVASDSMHPAIQRNDLVFYSEATFDDVSEGDIVIYKTVNNNGAKLIIHRLEQKNGEYFIAKGDHNSISDDPMHATSIVGKYMFKIENIGIVLNLLSTKWAPLIIFLIIACIFALRITLYYMHKKKTVSKITTKGSNRGAISHFFDV